MATAILDLDLQELPSRIVGLERYDGAFVLIRLNKKPVGKAWLKIERGHIGGKELRDILTEAAGSTLWKHWLHNYLDWDERNTSDFTPPTATVAVCTRDRPEDLRHCLEALMRIPDKGQELLVVDNCPASDETRKIVEGFGRVRYVREERPGLNIARNRALREAKHEVVAFTDDDAAPEPGWLTALLSNFNDPLVLCVTGLTMPSELETEAQKCFERYCPFERGFKRTVFEGTKQNPLATGRVGAGANMALRKNLIDLVGFFDEDLDAGTPTYSGGDHEMFARILLAGYRIVYDPAAVNWHRHRRNWKELRQTIFGYGVGVYAFWTRTLLVEKEWSMLAVAFSWLLSDQIPRLCRSLLRLPGSMPLDLILAELSGCIIGPWTYLSSRRRSVLERH
jgi:GT2 family glycosyltransferase